jgi:glycosyltransferase involved in cell wall biosynthesis
MRVVHVHRIAGIGGSERHLLTLLPALATAGIEASFVGLDGGGDPAPFYAELERADIAHRVASVRRLRRAIASFEPDLVHTHLVHADVFGAVAAGRRPLVSTKHNDDPFRAGPFRFVERALTRRAQAVITITEALARFQIERVGLPREKLTVVRYGLDAPPPAWADNPSLPLPSSARVLLGVGRLVRQKGYDVALQAFASIRERHPEAVLVIVGEGTERPQLERQRQELRLGESLHLPGRAGDVTAWLQRADVLVHPARWEGFGLVLLEAMLASLPVVATRVSAIPEIVADGETGLLVAADDPAALAGALGRVLDEPALAVRLGEAGLARARSDFSVERMAKATVEVYRRALG